jgi:hypothetical protein
MIDRHAWEAFPRSGMGGETTMKISIAIGLGLGLLVAAGCSMSRETAATDPCPPRAAFASAPAGTPTLAAGGKGVAPRVVEPVVDEGVTPASEPRLSSGGRGVPPRMEAGSTLGGAGTQPTPHLVAMPKGDSGPRVECR